MFRRDLYEAAERAEQRLGLPVNPVLCSRSRWIAAGDPLIQQIRSAPLVWVTGAAPGKLEYPDYPTEKASTEEASETLQTASEIIDAAARLLANLGFF